MKTSELLAKFDIVSGPDSNGNMQARCPAHADNEASLSLRIAKTASGTRRTWGHYLQPHCFAGCTFGAIIKAAGIRREDTRKLEHDAVDVKVSDARETARSAVTEADLVEANTRRQAAAERLAAHPHIVPEFERRGFDHRGRSADDLAAIGVGLTDSEDGYYAAARFSGPVAFEQSRGAAGWKTQPSPEGRQWSTAGQIGRVIPEAPWVICEGPGDALAVAATGKYNAIAVRGAEMASRSTHEMADFIQGKPIIVAGDADEAGRKFTETVANGLSGTASDVRVIDWPEGTEAKRDLTDLRAEDPGSFAERLELLATPYAVAEIVPTTANEVASQEMRYVSLDDHADLAAGVVAAIQANGDDLRFVPEKGSFAWWSGRTHAWQFDADAHVGAAIASLGQALKETAQRLRREAAAIVDPRERERVEDEAFHLAGLGQKLRTVYFRHVITTMMRESMPWVHAHIDDFDANPEILGVKGGRVVNLRDGSVRDARPDDLITQVVNVEYRPDATAPRWEQFISEIMVDRKGNPDPKVAAFMKRWLGYSLTGETREQKFAIYYGKGANGKSVLTEVLTHIVGPIVKTSPFSTFETKRGDAIPNDVARLQGARIVFTSEGGQRVMDEDQIKRLTGEDKMTARFMRQEFFEFTPRMKITMLVNHRPNFSQSFAVWRRVILVPFRRTFTEGVDRDDNLKAKLMAEAEGILTWLVAGAVEWYREGLKVPQTIRDEVEQYRESLDKLGEFLEDRLIVEKGAVTKCKDVLTAYREWAEDNHVDRPWQRDTLYDELETRDGITFYRKHPYQPFKNQAVLVGLRLLTDAERRARDHEDGKADESPIRTGKSAA